MKLEARVKVPGTCGELVQGVLDGLHYHVTCPVNIYSDARVEVLSGPSCYSKSSPEFCFPPGRTKSAEAVKKTLQVLGYSDLAAVGLDICSQLPLSKGMASSTADVSASIEATGLALGKKIDKKDVARIALSVEPTDGCFFPGIVLFDHCEGKLYELLGDAPPLDIVILDFGGEVDTLSFNNVDRGELYHSLEPKFKDALEMVRQGLKSGDTRLIGEAATLSSITHQSVLFKPQLDKVLQLAKEAGAAGVNIAHSGTVIGVLLERRKQDKVDISNFLRQHLEGLEKATLCTLTGGGSIVLRPDAV